MTVIFIAHFTDKHKPFQSKRRVDKINDAGPVEAKIWQFVLFSTLLYLSSQIEEWIRLTTKIRESSNDIEKLLCSGLNFVVELKLDDLQV